VIPTPRGRIYRRRAGQAQTKVKPIPNAIPLVPSLDWLDSALPTIHRALVTNGRLAVCVDPLPATQQRVRRTLARLGFSAVHATRAAGRLLFIAEIPTLRLRRCA